MSDVSNQPTLTIGLPVYNAGKELEDTIASIANQTWKGTKEILIVDDGSSEATVRTLDLMSARNPEIRVIRHPHNQGRPFARNTILENARGKYLTWIDADDEWYEYKLEAQFERLYSQNGDERRLICLSSYDWEWDNSGTIRRKSPTMNLDPLAGVISGKIGAYLWTMLATTKTFRSVGMFDTRLPRLQDLEFMIRYTSSGGEFTATRTNRPLCIYRKSDVGRTGESVEQSVRWIWKKHKLAYSAFGSRFERYAKQDQLQLVSRHYKNNKSSLKALGTFAQSILLAPKRGFKKIPKN